jgi:hypothetical protein
MEPAVTGIFPAVYPLVMFAAYLCSRPLGVVAAADG